MNQLEAMQIFVRVADLASFTQAAETMGLPKASVSAAVQQLESLLGTRLLHRTTRHVSVTKEGAAYYERATRLLNDLEETEAAVGQASRSYKGRLRVDTSGTLGRQIIVPALSDFFRRYPDIDLEIGCTDRAVDFVAGRHRLRDTRWHAA